MRTEDIEDFSKNIYHFTSAETALLYILPTLKLKLSTLVNVNDPKESSLAESWSLYGDCDLFEKGIVRDEFKYFVNEKCKLLCFSISYRDENGFSESGFKHPTMWAHYADKHKGVCIAINKEAFLKENNISDGEEFFFDEVKYKSVLKIPQIGSSIDKNNKDKSMRSFLKEHKSALFFEKHTHWSCEDEWRLVHIGDNQFCSIAESISGICLGSSFDRKNLLPTLKKCLPAHVNTGEFLSCEYGNLVRLPLFFR